MPSKDLETREAQKADYLKKSQSRSEALLKKGMNEAAVAKDPQIKHFKAKVKQINSAITRIAFLNDQTMKLKERKEQHQAEAAAKRAADIAGETKKKEKKIVEEKKPETSKKKSAAAGKSSAQGKPQQKKK
jgi:hypothetical protein